MQLELLEKSVPHQFRERVAQLLLGFAEHVHHIQTTSDGFRAPEAVWDKVAAHLDAGADKIVAALEREAADLSDDAPAEPVTDPSDPVTDPVTDPTTGAPTGDGALPLTPVTPEPVTPVADTAPTADAPAPAPAPAKTSKTAAK